MADETVYLNSTKVCERYGISKMTLRRWMEDPRKNFPASFRPVRNHLWKRSDIEEWEIEQARKTSR